MIFYDWKIALTYKDCHARLVQPWRELRAFRPHTLELFQRNQFSVEDAPRSGCHMKKLQHL